MLSQDHDRWAHIHSHDQGSWSFAQFHGFDQDTAVRFGESAQSSALAHNDFELVFDDIFESQSGYQAVSNIDLMPELTGSFIGHDAQEPVYTNNKLFDTQWSSMQGVGSWTPEQSLGGRYSSLPSQAAEVESSEWNLRAIDASTDFTVTSNYRRASEVSRLSRTESHAGLYPSSSHMQGRILDPHLQPEMKQPLTPQSNGANAQGSTITWEQPVTPVRAHSIYHIGRRSASHSRRGSTQSINSSTYHLSGSPMPSPSPSAASIASRGITRHSFSRISDCQSSFNALTLEEQELQRRKKRKAASAAQAKNRLAIRERGGACMRCKITKRQVRASGACPNFADIPQCQLSHLPAATSAASDASSTLSSTWSVVEKGSTVAKPLGAPDRRWLHS